MIACFLVCGLVFDGVLRRSSVLGMLHRSAMISDRVIFKVAGQQGIRPKRKKLSVLEKSRAIRAWILSPGSERIRA
jgi:hypothetical protein